MTASKVTLAVQRTLLLDRIATERGAMSASVTVYRRPLAWLNWGLSVSRFVRAHPIAVAASYALASIVLPRPLRRVASWWWLGRQLATVMAKSKALNKAAPAGAAEFYPEHDAQTALNARLAYRD